MLGDFSCKVALLVLGYLYPAYKTYKVVQLPATRTNDTLLRHWCTYWALMAAYTAVQPLADMFFWWLPLYYEAKLVAAIYLWANELAGAQYVWARWAQPLVSRYEPLFDRWLAESKALAREWLHSNAMHLLALAQQKFFAYLEQLRQQASGEEPAPRRAKPAVKRAGSKSRRPVVVEESEESEESAELVDDEEEELAEVAEVEEPAAAPAASGGKKEVRDSVTDLPAKSPGRFSSFSLASFYSARSADLQAADVKAGLKAFPISTGPKDD